MSSDDKWAFVGEPTGSMLVYSLTTGPPRLVRELSEGRSEYLGLTVTQDGRYLVAASGKGAAVFSVAALETGGSGHRELLGTFSSSGVGATEAAVSPDGRYAFITLEYSHEMAVFNLAAALTRGFSAADLVGYVPLGDEPVGMAISPDGSVLYATSEDAAPGNQEGTLTTIDLARAETDPAHAVISTVPAGCNPVRVVADGPAVFITARASDAVVEFSASALVNDPRAALEARVTVGEAPVGLALVNHNSVIVVADSNRFGTAGAHSDLAEVKVAKDGSMSLVGYLPAGAFPRDMAVSRDGMTLLVSNFGSAQLESVHVAALP